MIHRITLERFGLAQVAVEVQVGQVVLEQVAKGHRKVIVSAKHEINFILLRFLIFTSPIHGRFEIKKLIKVYIQQSKFNQNLYRIISYRKRPNIL